MKLALTFIILILSILPVALATQGAFQKKHQYDPNEPFSNTFYEHYKGIE